MLYAARTSARLASATTTTSRNIRPGARTNRRFATLPIEGEAVYEAPPCLSTAKDACGVLERVSRESKQNRGGVASVGSVFKITRRGLDIELPDEPEVEKPKRKPMSAGELNHVILGPDGQPLPTPPLDDAKSEGGSRSGSERRGSGGHPATAAAKN